MKNLKNINKDIGRKLRMWKNSQQRIPQGKPQLHWLILLIWLIFNHPYNVAENPLPLLLARGISNMNNSYKFFRHT